MKKLSVLFTLSLMLAGMMGMAQTAYITNEYDSTVSVINVATNTVIGIIKVGAYPNGVSVSPDGSKVYVTNDSTVSVINTATNSVSATIKVGSSPTSVAISPDGSKVYVTNDSTVSVINTATNAVTATIIVGDPPTTGVAVSPDGSKVYVVNGYDNKVSVINTATNTVSTTITVGSRQPYGVAVSPDGSKVYVTNYYSDSTVTVINTATNTVSDTIVVGDGPIGISVSPDGSKVYVVSEGSYTVSVINTGTDTVSAAIAVGALPIGVCVSPDGSKVYVANEYSNTISVINTATNTVSATIGVGQHPRAFGNFISTYTAPCYSNFSIAADTSQLHHYLVTDNSFGKQPIKYIWSWGDGSHDTIPYPSHTYANSGFYNICLSITDSAGCQNSFCDSTFHALRTTNTMVYVNVVNPLLTGAKEISLQTPEVVLYPNPANYQLIIRTSLKDEHTTISIMNMLGQTSPPTPLHMERGDALIDVSKLAAGMYFLQLKTESGSVVSKFVKE